MDWCAACLVLPDSPDEVHQTAEVLVGGSALDWLPEHHGGGAVGLVHQPAGQIVLATLVYTTDHVVKYGG